MKLPGDIPLVKTTEYPDTYSPDLLFPVPRELGRSNLSQPLVASLVNGVDRWTGYELSWLLPSGCPAVAIAEFDFCPSSVSIIESKSFKLYLNSFNQTVLSRNALIEKLKSDLSSVCQGDVSVRLFDADRYPISEPEDFQLIDSQDVLCSDFEVNSSLLSLASDDSVSEKLKSHVFRSLCPVTAQPDWASIYIFYKGKEICRDSLLKYLVSFRKHQGFHEQCVEMIFSHITKQLSPSQLTVFARFMRRGGLDINPLRSTQSEAEYLGFFTRTARQ